MKRFLATFLTVCMLCSLLPSLAVAEEELTLEFLDESFLDEELIPEELTEVIEEPDTAPADDYSEEPFIADALPDGDPLPILEEEDLLLTEELTEQEANLAVVDGFTVEYLSNGKARITDCSLSGDVVIPSTINGYTVRSLGEKLFFGRDDITSVFIPATVQYFGTSIYDNSWDYVFSYCANLKSIQVDPNNPVFCSVDGVLFSKDMSVLYNYPCGKSGSVYQIPEIVGEVVCTAFAYCRNLHQVYLNNNDAIFFTYSFYLVDNMTVYYKPGSFTEQRVSQFIESGLVYEKDSRFCKFQAMSSVTPSPSPDPSLTDADKPLIAYVERSYSLILGREGDKDGIEYWAKTLKSGVAAGADIVDSFCGSPEFTRKNLSNQQVVEILYRTMMDREPDSGGVQYWLGFLNDGLSIHYVINGFASSTEFKGICRTYGINAGAVALENRDQNPSVTAFVNRCYQVALGRNGDADGLNGWTGNLLNKTMSAQEVSYAFLFSEEFEAQKTDNGEFVNCLYRLYMNRTPDSAGRSGWVGQLNSGATRKSVAQGFANSDEFEAIVRSYGLDFTRENISPGPSGAPSPDAPLTKENILALLDAYDPDGAFIIRNSDDSSLLYWFHGGSALGTAAVNSMNTAVHEQCHDFTHNAGWHAEYIYVGNGNYINVQMTNVFDSIEMVSSIPSSLRTSRFNTYVNTEESAMSSRQFGVYGLLNEFTAYCWGNHNEVALYDYYMENDLLGNSSTDGFVSYAEFRYYILHYMLYARDHHPDVYQGILNNSSFKTAFTSVDATFRDVVSQWISQQRWIYSGYENQYNVLMNEMSKPEYVNMANLLIP